jgi:hypothetical protein
VESAVSSHRVVVRTRRLPYAPLQDKQELTMAANIKLSLTEDEAEIIADALEVDMENYAEAAKEARGNNQRDDVKTFTEAAERIAALLAKVRGLLGD